MDDWKSGQISMWMQRGRLSLALMAMGYPVVGALVLAFVAGSGSGRSV